MGVPYMGVGWLAIKKLQWTISCKLGFFRGGYLEDHPRYRKWLGLPPCISYETAIYKGNNHILSGLTITMVINHWTDTWDIPNTCSSVVNGRLFLRQASLGRAGLMMLMCWQKTGRVDLLKRKSFIRKKTWLFGPSKIEWDLPNGPLSVSCDRAIRYPGFFWVRETWVLLEISWIWVSIHTLRIHLPLLSKHQTLRSWHPETETASKQVTTWHPKPDIPRILRATYIFPVTFLSSILRFQPSKRSFCNQNKARLQPVRGYMYLDDRNRF